jgi:hypothetical protein
LEELGAAGSIQGLVHLLGLDIIIWIRTVWSCAPNASADGELPVQPVHENLLLWKRLLATRGAPVRR